MTEKKDKKLTGLLYLLLLIPVLMFGFFGAFIAFLGDSSSVWSGFLGGIAVGVVLCGVIGVGTLGWEWVKKEAAKGRLLPYMIVGFVVAIAISAYLASSLGSPSCLESDTDNRGSTCLEYADDGFEATSTQKWNKFWGTLPVTLIITSLSAVIVRNEMEKNNKK